MTVFVRLFLSGSVTSQLGRYSSKSRCDMNKIEMLGFAVLVILGTMQPSEAKPVGTDRYRVEFNGTEGKRLKASVSWNNGSDIGSKYQSQDISRQIPIAFEIDLPYGSGIIAAGSIPGKDPISIKIFMNGFQCDDATGIAPSNTAVRSCHP